MKSAAQLASLCEEVEKVRELRRQLLPQRQQLLRQVVPHLVLLCRTRCSKVEIEILGVLYCSSQEAS